MFDKLMLLAKGKVIYFNNAEFAVDYFSRIGFKCPELSNPADYFMSIMSIETIEQEDTEDAQALQSSQRDIQQIYKQRIKKFSDSYAASELRNNPDEVDKSVVPLSANDQALQRGASWCY